MARSQVVPTTNLPYNLEHTRAVSKHFVQNSTLRKLLISSYRVYARSQFLRSGPRIFVNSIPKAGTHLLTAELQRLGDVQNSRLHLDIDRVGLKGTNGAFGFPKIDITKTERALKTVRAGQMLSAHLYWSKELDTLLADANMKSIFIARDPRDIVLSRMHYAMGLRRHRLHNYLVGLPNDLERLRSLIVGRESGPFIRPLSDTLRGYRPWLESPTTLAVRFEDLVGERGGGSAELKLQTLRAIVDFCGLDDSNVEAMANVGTGPTPTMRKGKAGGWKDELPAEIVDLFERELGDYISAYDYPLG